MSAEFILGVIAAVIFLVVVAHVVALRRYASLFEAPAETRAHDGSGQVSGRIGGRDAAFSLSLPRRRPKQSGALRISVACAGPLDTRPE